MPCYMVIDGNKQEMDEDIFDQMVEVLHNPTNTHEPPIPTTTRWKPDGTYDKKPLDPNYFSKYYQKKLSTPFHLSRLRTDNFVQIQSIQTSPNQHLYEEKMPMLIIQNFLNNNHFY